MAKNNKSSAGEERRRAQADKMNAELAKERDKAAKKREKDRARQQRDAERYQKMAAQARQKAADERARQEALKNDPKYLEKQRREAEKLKARGKKEMEKQRRRSEKKAKAAARSKAKQEAMRKEGLATVERSSRRGADKAAHSTPAEARSGRKKGSVVALVVILAALVASVFLLYPPQDKITMGLDIQGGVSVNLSASTNDGSTITSDQMSRRSRSSPTASTHPVPRRRRSSSRGATPSWCRFPALRKTPRPSSTRSPARASSSS